jgi:predicted O-methyltransferase YrrM
VMDAGGEPFTSEMVDDWIAQQLRQQDPFAHVAALSDEHRAQHGCTIYPSGSGNLLGVLAAATRARRLLEVGCGLGYSALWLALGAGPEAVVETIEQDEVHAQIARGLIRDAGFSERIRVHVGDYRTLLSELDAVYDILFYDAAIPAPEDLAQFARLVRQGGILLSSNIFLGVYDPQNPDLLLGAAYRRAALENGDWFTAFIGTKAISVRR